jgi:hypothetical protein
MRLFRFIRSKVCPEPEDTFTILEQFRSEITEVAPYISEEDHMTLLREHMARFSALSRKTNPEHYKRIESHGKQG